MISKENLINEIKKTNMLHRAVVGGGIPIAILEAAIVGIASIGFKEKILALTNNQSPMEFTQACVDFEIASLPFEPCGVPEGL